jgi:predicted 2-oxoglutarate/Fe(II)-dependent dioxygenase YbiX
MLTKPEIYANKIYYYKNVIDSPEQLIAQIEESDSKLTADDPISIWNDWVASGDEESYTYGSIKYTDEQKLETGSHTSILIHRTLKTALSTVGVDYAKQLGVDYIDPMPISISKYKVGAEMGPHVDYYGEPDIEPLMSAVIYLNDNYDGGELSFSKQNITIKPSAGSILVFPSVDPFYHEPLPVISGTKYISAAFWVKNLN